MRLGDHGHRLEGEAVDALAGWEASFGEVTLDAPSIALGDLVLGQAGEEPGGRPALAIGPCSDLGPDLLDGGQPEVVQDEGEALGVDRLRRWLGGRLDGLCHAAAPASRAS